MGKINKSKGITLGTKVLLCGRKVVMGKRIEKRLIKSECPEMIEIVYNANRQFYDYFITYDIRIYLDEMGNRQTEINSEWKLYKDRND